MEQTISLHHWRPSNSPLTKRNQTIRPVAEVSSLVIECKRFESLLSLKQFHASILKTSSQQYYTASFMENLIRAYSKFGDLCSAAMVFFMGFKYGLFSWNYLVELYRHSDATSELLEIFRFLHRKDIDFTVRVLNVVLRACAKLVEMYLGMQIHALAVKLGLDEDSYLKCSMMDLYAGLMSMDSVAKLVDEMPPQDSISWNKAVALYVENEMFVKAVNLFSEMQFSNVSADEVAFAKIMHACGKLKALQIGKQVHTHAIRSGLISKLLVSNSLIAMYSKISSVASALKVFESIQSKNLVSWNSMISCYSLNGFLKDAMELQNEMISSGIRPDLVTWNSLLYGHSLHGSNHMVFDTFRKMQDEGVKLNSSSITSVLRPISDHSLVELGKEVHGHVMRHGLECNVYVGTSLVDMYMNCCQPNRARKVFNGMPYRNVCTWNSLISGYVHDGFLDEALNLLKQMEKEGIQPNLTTWNYIVYGLSSKGHGKKALALLHRLQAAEVKPDVVSWTSLISGCCRDENYEDSLNLFTEMHSEGIEPNEATIASLLQACAALALLKKGKELHCFAMRKGFSEDVFVATALIDMYCKSGELQTALKIFKNVPNLNLATYNAMIMGFAAHGHGKEAISLFDRMRELGNEPDSITFTAVLSACRHSGLVTEGWKFFDYMQNYYLVTPRIEHFTCMVDLLARNGYLDEAFEFIQSMPLEPDASVWGALLAACKTHKNLDLAEVAAKHLFKLEPYNSANYLLMMNLYAYENRWEDFAYMRDAMHAAGVKSRSGWSWIQIEQKLHVFHVEGKTHPDIGEIYFELYQIITQIRSLDYQPDTSCVAHDISEEEKEKLLLSHTEKLAITYGLIRTGDSSPVRVITNTRVCNDCHTVAKYMSRITGREIFLRAGVRFHRFVDGKCSCKDYW